MSPRLASESGIPASRFTIASEPRFASALASARAGRSVSGEHDGLSYTAVPVGAAGDAHGDFAPVGDKDFLEHSVVVSGEW